MKIKVHHEKQKEWGPVRQGIFWAAFCILLALAALEAGWILRDFQKDKTGERIIKIEDKYRDHDGRIVAIEGKKQSIKSRINNESNNLSKP